MLSPSGANSLAEDGQVERLARPEPDDVAGVVRPIVPSVIGPLSVRLWGPVGSCAAVGCDTMNGKRMLIGLATSLQLRPSLE